MPIEVVPRDEVDLSLWLDIDLDAVPPCEWDAHDRYNTEKLPAEWARLDAKVIPCGCFSPNTMLMCDHCKDVMTSPDITFICDKCGLVPVYQSDVHYRFVAI